MFSHAGDLGGWNADMRIDRDAHLVLVFLSNQRIDGKGSRTAVMTPVTLLATGAAVPELPAVRTPRTGELAALAGRWRVADGGTLVTRARGTALEVAASDRAGLLRLAGEGSAPPESLHLESRALAIAEGMGRRRLDPLRTALSPSLPFNAVAPDLDTQLADTQRRLGAFVRAEPIGTVFAGPGAALSFVRIHYRKGSTLLRLGWANNQVLAIDPEASAALPTRFLPADDGAWVHVDPFTARVTRIHADRDAKGKVQSLAVGGESVEARARRSG
jgi:hypothetical protein